MSSKVRLPLNDAGLNLLFGQAAAITPLVILSIALGVLWLLLRHTTLLPRLYNSPRRLFFQLCLAHKLDWNQRRLLRRMARVHGMELAAMLFLSPEKFSANAIPGELEPFREQIDRLRRTLFGPTGTGLAAAEK